MIVVLGVGAFVAISSTYHIPPFSQASTDHTPSMATVRLQPGCVGCYQGGTLPSIPPSVLALDGVPVNDSNYLNGTALVSGSHHTISAALSYTGPCPSSEPPCGYYGIRNITVYFQHWSACVYYPVPSNTTEVCAATDVPDSQSNSIGITLPTPGALGGLLEIYTAVYSPGTAGSSNSTTSTSMTSAAVN